MLTSFKRIVRSGFVGFWRNAFVSLSAIFVITVTLTVIGAMMLFGQILNASLAQIKDKVDINVYFVTSADDTAVQDLVASLKALNDVASVTYTSREDALAAFRERHKNDQLTIQALEELGENPLGASLAIRAKDPNRYENIATFLQQHQNVESPDKPIIDRINFKQNKEAIDKLTRIIETTQRVSSITMIVLIVASILIAFNTIRLTIYISREEISVMRLVGASNMFIRGPFMLQGVMYGFLAGVLALLILYPSVLWLGPRTATFFNFDILSYFVTHFGMLFGVLVGSGVVLGIVSSMLAIARYLRV